MKLATRNPAGYFSRKFKVLQLTFQVVWLTCFLASEKIAPALLTTSLCLLVLESKNHAHENARKAWDVVRLATPSAELFTLFVVRAGPKRVPAVEGAD